MKTLKNRKWYSVIKRQRVPKVRIFHSPLTFLELTDTDEVIRIVHVAEKFATHHGGMALLKEDYKKVAGVPNLQLSAWVHRFTPEDVKKLAEYLKTLAPARVGYFDNYEQSLQTPEKSK